MFAMVTVVFDEKFGITEIVVTTPFIVKAQPRNTRLSEPKPKYPLAATAATARLALKQRLLEAIVASRVD